MDAHSDRAPLTTCKIRRHSIYSAALSGLRRMGVTLGAEEFDWSISNARQSEATNYLSLMSLDYVIFQLGVRNKDGKRFDARLAGCVRIFRVG